MEPRVASRLASFGASGAKALDFSAAPLVRLRLPVGLRVSPRAAPSGFASGGTFESPRIPAPLAPGDGVAEFPQPPHPPALPSLRLRVSPNPASTAGLTVTPRFSSNFASSAKPRMSIRFQSGRVHSSPDLDAFSISFGRVAYRQAGLLSTKFNRFLHRLPGRKYASNTLRLAPKLTIRSVNHLT
jgi:hypothetical protein